MDNSPVWGLILECVLKNIYPVNKIVAKVWTFSLIAKKVVSTAKGVEKLTASFSDIFFSEREIPHE